MTRKKEIYANELFKDLKEEFDNDTITINIEGAGVHWHCKANAQENKCMIYCGDINRIDVTYKGTEYNIYFYNSNEEITSGRTFDKFEAIASIKDWFAYPNLEVMYVKYAFIDFYAGITLAPKWKGFLCMF